MTKNVRSAGGKCCAGADTGIVAALFVKIMQPNEKIAISNHALLRYLERVKGVDVEAARQEIRDGLGCPPVQELGDGKYPLTFGAKAVIRSRTIVTIIVKEKKKQKIKYELELF